MHLVYLAVTVLVPRFGCRCRFSGRCWMQYRILPLPLRATLAHQSNVARSRFDARAWRREQVSSPFRVTSRCSNNPSDSRRATATTRRVHCTIGSLLTNAAYHTRRRAATGENSVLNDDVTACYAFHYSNATRFPTGGIIITCRNASCRLCTLLVDGTFVNACSSRILR